MDLSILSNAPLRWGASGNNRIIQNVVNLLNTFTYEVSFDRTLGLKKDIIDLPLPLAKARIPYEVTRLIQEKEPRVKVKSVTLNGIDEKGNLDMKVVISI